MVRNIELRLNLDRGIWPDRCRRCSLIQVIDVNDERALLNCLPLASKKNQHPKATA